MSTQSNKQIMSYNDEIKTKDKLTVNGYIREAENNNLLSNNIPLIINYFCIKYYHESKDRFDPKLLWGWVEVTDDTVKWKCE